MHSNSEIAAIADFLPFEFKVKLLICLNNSKFYGPGPHTLLKNIQQISSVKDASEQMGMSYRKAWSIINHLEESLGSEIVIRQQGGVGGGNATVSDLGSKLIQSYDALEQKTKDYFIKTAEEEFAWLKDTDTQPDQ